MLGSLLIYCMWISCDFECREELLFEHDLIPEAAVFPNPSEIGSSDGIMGCGGARLGPGPGPNGQGSSLTKGSIQGAYGGHGRVQTSKHGSASSSRLGHKHYKQPYAQIQQNYTNFPISPQHSFTSGSQSGNSSGPPSRRFPSGESSSHSSPAGVLHFQQRQYQQHSPHHSSDHQNLSGSPLHRSGKAADTGKPPSDGLLPLPQMDTRGLYAGHAMKGHFMGQGNAGYTGAGIIPDGRGLPMAAGLGQQHHFGAGAPIWPAQNPIFPPGQIYATDQLFAGEYEVWSFLK